MEMFGQARFRLLNVRPWIMTPAIGRRTATPEAGLRSGRAGNAPSPEEKSNDLGQGR
jgi:hypothetical protein